MGFARFIAKDVEDPAATEKELQELISKARGVVDWAICPNGDVAIEYDRHQTSGEIIEEAFTRLGFQLEHIADEPNAGEVQVREAVDC